MKMTKKLLSVVLAIAMSASLMVPVFAVTEGADGADTLVKTYEIYSSEEEWEAALREHIAISLEERGIESGTVYLPGDPMLANNIDDYKTEVVSTKRVVVSGYAGNQPAGGVCINSSSGGAIYYTPNDGPTASVSVAFGDPYGVVSVNFELGKRVSEVSQYSANIPGFKYYRLYADNTYTVSHYIVYKRVWVSDMEGYQWKEYSSGQQKVLYSVKLTPIAV